MSRDVGEHLVELPVAAPAVLPAAEPPRARGLVRLGVVRGQDRGALLVRRGLQGKVVLGADQERLQCWRRGEAKRTCEDGRKSGSVVMGGAEKGGQRMAESARVAMRWTAARSGAVRSERATDRLEEVEVGKALDRFAQRAHACTCRAD